MRLTKLILEQFRNYQKLELDFDPAEPMTYIVGPNAQGKTNILESIYLLALTKSFRTAKQQDMIGWSSEFARVKGFFEVGDAANQADSIHELDSGRPKARPASPAGSATPSSRTASNAASLADFAGSAESIAVTDNPISSNNSAKFSSAAQNQPIELEAFLGKPPHPQKAFKKNGVKISATNFIGNCQVVFFHPEDLNMLYLGPELRRNYLNVINVQTNRKYFSALRSYQKILKQRNALLRAIATSRLTKMQSLTSAQEDELNIWDEQLVEHGSYLMFERAKTVQYFQNRLTATYQKISQGNEKVSMNYRHTLHKDFSVTGAASSQAAQYKNEDHDFADTDGKITSLVAAETHFAQALAGARARDLLALVTTVGPHRDDLDFTLNDLSLSALASRGEYRSLLLALKLIELNFFEDRTHQKPLLLLDDVFSELDPARQNLLLQAIEGHQTIITTTHIAESKESNANSRRHQSLRPGKFLKIQQGFIHSSIE